jgi:hypothetical protein
MKITSIDIKNVKGIAQKSLSVNILPNKPNLLVAPNGFGKSSIATAFSSMNSKRMTLNEKDCHQEDESKAPELAITTSNGHLIADNTKNEIRQAFDVTVIRSGLRPKATQRRMGGFTSSTASLEVESIPLREIPDKVFFAYKASDFKASFGANGKVIPNINSITTSPLLCRALAGVDLEGVMGKRIQERIVEFVSLVNQQSGSADQIIDWIAQNSVNELRSIPVLSKLAANLSMLRLTDSEPEAFLAAYQLIEIYKSDRKSFEAAYRWLDYTRVRSNYDNLLKDLCSSSWKWATLKEDKKHKLLLVEFPKAHQLSNGQRDLVTLVVQMHKALYEGSRKPLILIIDEVFDYLDDANLVAFQYYVTSLIEKYRQRDQLVYPIILTHLDPGVFFDFCFNKHKIHVHYLQAIASPKSKDILKLIETREVDAVLKDLLEKHWFHFHPDLGVIAESDWPKSLPADWRESAKFHGYTTGEVARYLMDKNYDPLAICFALRVKVEERAHAAIGDPAQQAEFLDVIHTTKSKIEYVADRGLEVPEIHLLLGLIYNTNLHWKAGRDYVSPLVAKLNHPTIRHMISQIFH